MMRLVVFIYCLLFVPSGAWAQDEMPMQLLQRVQASLVEIRTLTTKTVTEANGHTEVGSYHTQGSGVILNSYGLIVTNTHIVTGAAHIYVGLPDGKILEAKLVYSSDADFSFIKVDPPYPLTPIAFADSSSVPVGTSILALSYDDGDQQHVLGGAITNLINGTDSNDVEVLELNLNLYHGDSGGPVLDAQGQLLGLIMAKTLSENDKSYAVASNKIQREYEQYQQNLST